jgi:deazaflavin-dependent oxidoreductase (nitroreductase family)
VKRITLTTTGRRSGEPRKASLYAFDDGDHLVVVGSLGGSAKDPAWALNLRSEPRASVASGKEEWHVRAREVTGPDRARVWDVVCEGFPMYRSFQRKTTRLIPLFALEPTAAGDQG